MSGALAPPPPPAAGQLTIERLAAELEQAVRVDEIKDVRDRAMAIQLYSRKKQGGLAAAQSAGRIVTDATLRLAKLYAEEKSVQGRRQRDEPLSHGSEDPGKQAIAAAAGMAAPNLARLKPLVDTPREDVHEAMAAIEARGDVVTPRGLMREVVGEPDKVPRARVVVVINGRRLSTAQVASLTSAVIERAGRSVDVAIHEIKRLLEGRKKQG